VLLKIAKVFFENIFDVLVNADLLATGLFEVMDTETDEAEHSIEMHLPYVAKMFERCVLRRN
jgi:predicted class III extradiol MEMO1 family dioxygenase